MSGLYTHLRKENIRLWRIWYRMNRRCENKEDGTPIDKNYANIKVDDTWNRNTVGDAGFVNFYDDMIDGYDDSLELDRIDPYGNYEPNNCRWVTRTVNMNNTRWHNSEYGKRYLKAIESGLNRHTIYGRLERGWSVEDAFTMPADRRAGNYATRKKRNET